MPAASGSDTLSQSIFTTLVADLDVTFPALPDLSGVDFDYPDQVNNPLYDPVETLDNDALTTGIVGGTGLFDKLMVAIRAQLKVEYDEGRLTGDQYTKAVVELTGVALGTATSFLTSRDQTYWQNLLVQAQGRAAEIGVITARVNHETAKAAMVQTYSSAIAGYKVSQAQYALNKMGLATSDADYLIKLAQESVQSYQASDILPTQKSLLSEQYEAARAQTLDTRSDELTPVTGSVGKQKELHSQQIDSYQKDSRYKVAKMLVDGWITQKTLDEGLTAPGEMTNATIDTVLTSIRTDNSLT